MGQKRFSKATVGERIGQRIATLVARYKFDLNGGTAQCWPHRRELSGGDQVMSRDELEKTACWGEVRALMRLAGDMDVDWRTAYRAALKTWVSE